VRRLLAGLRAAGVGEVLYMPDRYGLVARAAEDLPDLLMTPATQVCSDIPEDTLRATEAMVQANARVLAIDAGKTLLFERERMIKEADQAGIAIVAMKDH